MPETTREVLLDMRVKVQEELTEKWSNYIGDLVVAYDNAEQNVRGLLAAIKSEIDAEKELKMQLLVAGLSILSAGLLGPAADSLVAKLPTHYDLELHITPNDISWKWIEADTYLHKVMKGTLKTAISDTGSAVNSALNQVVRRFNSPVPSDGFSPAGMTTEEYRNALGKGLRSRAKVLTNILNAFYEIADAISPEIAQQMRKGLLQNDFFTTNPVSDNKEAIRAEIAIWCAWALDRDMDYWSDSKSDSESVDFSPVRERLIELGFPLKWVKKTYRPMGKYLLPRDGLDVAGLATWVRLGWGTKLALSGVPAGDEVFAHANARMLPSPIFRKFAAGGI